MRTNVSGSCPWTGWSFAASALLATAGAAGAKETAALTPAPLEPKAVFLPAPRWTEVAGGIALRHGSEERFAAAVEGEVLRLDLDGDGTLDARIEGEDANVTLTGRSPEGNPLRYAVRLAHTEGEPWRYTCGGVMAGEVAGVRVAIVDQNLNGEFDDVGEDAVFVGRDSAASFLSRVVVLEGKPYEIAVARDGASLEFAPYAGPTGVLDLASGFEAKAKLRAAVVRSVDGTFSFNLSKAREGLRVPAGKYVLVAGQLALGSNTAEIHTGRSAPIEVAPDATVRVAWGGPVRGEFAYERAGGKVQFTPWDIWYYGKLGEEYSKFLPLGTSPEFTIADAETGKPLVNATFPGNC